jgi:exopolysaccharide/PEP-CTERM locus tyrosine autokinase
MSIVEKALKTADSSAGRKSAGKSIVGGRASGRGVPKSSAVANFSDEHLSAAGYRGSDPDANRHLGMEFRRLKRPIIQHARNRKALGVRHGNIISITSALPQEGKTFCAINLALTLARERDIHVILIDGDIHSPKLTSAVSQSDTQGLTEYLKDGSIQFEDIVQRTGVDNLSFVPAGTGRWGSHELLASHRAEQLMDYLSDDDADRIVVIDGPPLIPTTEAQVIAGLAGMVLMCVDAQSTLRGAIVKALQLIDEEKAVTLILNRGNHSRGGDYYGNYYGYGTTESDTT